MIDGCKFFQGEPVYTFVANDGTNTHIHAGRLRAYLQSQNHEIILAPVRKALAQRFLAENAISMERVAELTARQLALAPDAPPDPIILCHTPGGQNEYMLVDGHHRYFIAAFANRAWIHSWLVEPDIWEAFQVINLRDLTQAELNAAPLGKRNY